VHLPQADTKPISNGSGKFRIAWAGKKLHFMLHCAHYNTSPYRRN
jgi:hypothetical protein